MSEGRAPCEPISSSNTSAPGITPPHLPNPPAHTVTQQITGLAECSETLVKDKGSALHWPGFVSTVLPTPAQQLCHLQNPTQPPGTQFPQLSSGDNGFPHAVHLLGDSSRHPRQCLARGQLWINTHPCCKPATIPALRF